MEYLFKFFCWWLFISLFFILFIRFETSRRSVSNCVSPGPLSPIPPFCLSKWLQPLTHLVERCDNCANSTCIFPIWLEALRAKISKIKPVLSNTLEFKKLSMLRSWEGDKSWLKITKEQLCWIKVFLISSSFPFPIKYFALIVFWWKLN